MRCDWSDLPIESCGHCRGIEAPEAVEAAAFRYDDEEQP